MAASVTLRSPSITPPGTPPSETTKCFTPSMDVKGLQMKSTPVVIGLELVYIQVPDDILNRFSAYDYEIVDGGSTFVNTPDEGEPAEIDHKKYLGTFIHRLEEIFPEESKVEEKAVFICNLLTLMSHNGLPFAATHALTAALSKDNSYPQFPNLESSSEQKNVTYRIEYLEDQGKLTLSLKEQYRVRSLEDDGSEPETIRTWQGVALFDLKELKRDPIFTITADDLKFHQLKWSSWGKAYHDDLVKNKAGLRSVVLPYDQKNYKIWLDTIREACKGTPKETETHYANALFRTRFFDIVQPVCHQALVQTNGSLNDPLPKQCDCLSSFKTPANPYTWWDHMVGAISTFSDPLHDSMPASILYDLEWEGKKVRAFALPTPLICSGSILTPISAEITPEFAYFITSRSATDRHFYINLQPENGTPQEIESCRKLKAFRDSNATTFAYLSPPSTSSFCTQKPPYAGKTMDETAFFSGVYDHLLKPVLEDLPFEMKDEDGVKPEIKKEVRALVHKLKDAFFDKEKEVLTLDERLQFIDLIYPVFYLWAIQKTGCSTFNVTHLDGSSKDAEVNVLMYYLLLMFSDKHLEPKRMEELSFIFFGASLWNNDKVGGDKTRFFNLFEKLQDSAVQKRLQDAFADFKPTKISMKGD